MAAVAHESRNALQRILAHAEALGPPANRELDARRHLRSILAARELKRLHEDLTGYASPVRPEPAPTYLPTTWRRAWSELAELRERRDATLREHRADVEHRCRIDADAMTRVFRDLFENSLLHCPDPLRVDVHCKDVAPGFLRVCVRDNGPGVPPGIVERIFEPFFSTRPRGTGLGLSIARRTLRAHGGELVLADGARGAEFVLTIPTIENARPRTRASGRGRLSERMIP